MSSNSFADWEAQYLTALADKLSETLRLKKNGSLLALGANQWKLGQAVATLSNAKTYVYADIDSQSIEAAEKAGIFTAKCDFMKQDHLASLGKFDGILMKGIFEDLGPGIDCEEFLIQMWKCLKLRGKIILITRFRLPVQLPAQLNAVWQNSLTKSNAIEIACKETKNFDFAQLDCKFPVKLNKRSVESALKSNTHFITSIGPAFKDQVAKIPDTIEGDDEVSLVCLTKIISKNEDD